jgi:hypothetical protein
VTLAKGVVASCRRAARGSASVPPPPPADPPMPASSPTLPRSPAHPGGRLVERGAARLRRAVADELAARHAATAAVAAETAPAAPPPGGAAATMAAARRALVLKNAAAGLRPTKAAARPLVPVVAPAVAGQHADGTGNVAAAAPITGFPRRPRAP